MDIIKTYTIDQDDMFVVAAEVMMLEDGMIMIDDMINGKEYEAETLEAAHDFAQALLNRARRVRGLEVA